MHSSRFPHGTAAETGRALAARGIKVVDFSADWRLRDSRGVRAVVRLGARLSRRARRLGVRHAGAVPERDRGGHARGEPRLLPERDHARPRAGAARRRRCSGGIVVDAASGVSGAGKNVSADYLFTELDGSFKAYRVGNHQHTPEVEQELSVAADEDVRITFVPHLAPMARGILATCYAQMTAGVDAVRDALQTAYKGEPFVHVLETQPTTKQVSGTNHVLIGVAADERTNTVVVTSAIDNLGKGAAGQAVQNANLMLGLDETSGLQTTAVYP